MVEPKLLVIFAAFCSNLFAGFCSDDARLVQAPTRNSEEPKKISAEELHCGIGHRPHFRALPSGLSNHAHPLQQAQD